MAWENATVFFATNRKGTINARGGRQIWTPAEGFGTWPNEFQAGMATVRFWRTDEVLGERMDNEAKYASAEPAGQGSEAVFAALLECSRPGEDGRRRSVLFFVHGFGNSFQDAIETGAKLADLYGSADHDLVPFVFSWPSLGRTSQSAYPRDRKIAKTSGTACAEVLERLIKHVVEGEDGAPLVPCYLFTHSMGAYVLRFALQELLEAGNSVSPIFESILLAAPDVDADAFENPEKLFALHRLGREVVVYANQRDQALVVAEDKTNTPRLGHNGPSTDARRGFAAPLTVRCGAADNFRTSDPLRHWYYRRSIGVVKDIKAVLAGREPDAIKRRKRVRGEPGTYRLKLPQKFYDADDPP